MFFSFKYKLVNGKLEFVDPKDSTKIKLFIEKLKEGQELDVVMTSVESKGSNAQIAKIHASIRQIANELGYSFEEMKVLVKKKSGLIYKTGPTLIVKSFSECSKEDLNSVIQTCQELANEYGILLG